MNDVPAQFDPRKGYFDRGDYLMVALPDELVEFIPTNASNFVQEWELALDPIRVFRRAAQHFLADYGDLDNGGWSVRGHFVVPTFATLHWLRLAAKDGGVLSAFESADAVLRFEEGVPSIGISAMLESKPESDETDDLPLDDYAQPVLLGLAVTATSFSLIGPSGQKLREALDEIEQRRRAEDEKAFEERRRRGALAAAEQLARQQEAESNQPNDS